jgi:hypothetical protein
MQEVFVPLLTAVVTAVAGTVGAWILARVRSGRSARSLEQGTKLIEFLGQYCECYSRLDKLSASARIETEQLLLEIVRGVREDFAAERALLPQFGQGSSSLRHALLLDCPRKPIMWLPRMVFYSLLLFVPYVVVIRATQGRWTWADTFAILLSCLLAASVRLIVRLVSTNEGR